MGQFPTYTTRTWESDDGKSSLNFIVVPKSIVEEIITGYHEVPSCGHLGVAKTVNKIKKRFYWMGCQEAVADFISTCEQCVKAKGPMKKSRGKMSQYNVEAPFERIAVDVAGPFPESNHGSKYVLVVIDYFSK